MEEVFEYNNQICSIAYYDQGDFSHYCGYVYINPESQVFKHWKKSYKRSLKNSLQDFSRPITFSRMSHIFNVINDKMYLKVGFDFAETFDFIIVNGVRKNKHSKEEAIKTTKELADLITKAENSYK